MKQATKQAMKQPGGILCCSECIKQIESRYIAVEDDREARPGQCPICFKHKFVNRYSISPIRKKYQTRSGGGERAKAGGNL